MWRINQNQDSLFHTRKASWENKTVFHATQDWWFSQLLFIKQIKKLAYHRSYYKILGKHHVADVRHKSFESTPGDIITWSDYAEQFCFDPDGQIQNELFDNNRSLSMEGCCLYCFIKKSNESSFYDICGGDVHQYNYTVQEFYFTFIWFKAAL